uniref:Uncharacterized protein n=1 Tax=Timema shepardi TaxID=629360 RepID=A0A7R9G5D3_TIMSH|nr:unnamed protein product [Timema shepardi]
MLSSTAEDGEIEVRISSANGTLSEGTLWWTARQMRNTPHYEIHNKYGLLHAGAVSSATGSPNDSLLLSASCYTGGGTVAGCLYRSTASWDSLSEAVEVALGQGLADHPSYRFYQKAVEVGLEQQIASTGVAINSKMLYGGGVSSINTPLIYTLPRGCGGGAIGVPLPGGSSICGSDGNYTEELCLRWYSLGVVLPLMRVSSQLPLRDPLQLSSKADIQSVKTSLLLRYSLLPYYYTLLREASQTGTPIIRPMFMEFPTDNRAWDLNQQFMLAALSTIYQHHLSQFKKSQELCPMTQRSFKRRPIILLKHPEVNAGKRSLFGHLCCVEDSRSMDAIIGRMACSQHRTPVGSSLLAVPGLKEGAVTVEAYLPDENNTTWYLLAGGHPVNNGTGNITVIIPSSASEMVLLVRGGHIVPTQEPGTDATTSRNGTYKLIIGLQCDVDDPNNCTASGRMTFEEGVTLYFTADSTSVTVDNLIDVCSKMDEVAHQNQPLGYLTHIGGHATKTSVSSGLI